MTDYVDQMCCSKQRVDTYLIIATQLCNIHIADFLEVLVLFIYSDVLMTRFNGDLGTPQT